MYLYNTMSRQKEQFVPGDGPIKVYVCGITPYDTTHLGHLFTYSTYDVLIRYLEYTGCSTLYAQNVTDIDDDILKRARELDEDWQTLGNRWTVHFIEDNQALNLRPPNHYPRATDVIDGIVESVEALLTSGVAYQSNGSVYYHLDADEEYGKLSQLPRHEMLPIANERGNFPDDPKKRDPLDFVLWQAQAANEPAWNSPWGLGRPGWHIECSTMSAKFLGTPVDIHGGGADLIFPHHECEIAQAESATGQKPFVRFWMHVAMLSYQGQKMSKSLGNLVMVRDLLESGWEPDVLRLCMARRHYRIEWEYRDSDLEEADAIIEQLRGAVKAESDSGAELDISTFIEEFQSAMDDDLNTPEAVLVLIALAKEILARADTKDVANAQGVLRELSSIMGMRLDAVGPEESVTAGWNEHRKRFVFG
jgi:L-cysteine:1D-myo-inositol 2-amino-2-deoxy-alpha-D-glucopyranoside ligase